MHVRVLKTQVQPDPLIEVAVRPAGRLSVTVTRPELAEASGFVTAIW
jgi:hypothetical protein